MFPMQIVGSGGGVKDVTHMLAGSCSTHAVHTLPTYPPAWWPPLHVMLMAYSPGRLPTPGLNGVVTSFHDVLWSELKGQRCAVHGVGPPHTHTHTHPSVLNVY